MQRQTTPYTLTQYLAAGCQTLTRDGKLDLIGAGIHAVTEGMPCNGCHMLKLRCASFEKLRAADTPLPKAAQPGETVRAEAARRGLSIGEVRRQRQAAVGAA
jgi:hypothetical protein